MESTPINDTSLQHLSEVRESMIGLKGTPRSPDSEPTSAPILSSGIVPTPCQQSLKTLSKLMPNFFTPHFMG
ncbi:hypothetical protein ACTXT7_014938 [Hymenolepis weldensis]